MNGLIVTDLDGRLRVRLAQPGLGVADFERLTGLLMKAGGIKYCAYNRYTCSLLVLFDHSTKRRKQLLTTMHDYEIRYQKPISCFEAHQIDAGEDRPLPHNPLYSYFLKRLFLPLQVRTILNIISAIPYLLEGLHFLLWKNHLTVEVLDASALSVCLFRRDFNSVGTLLFFFSLSNYLEAWTRRRSLTGLYHSLIRQEEMIWIRSEDNREIRIKESDLNIGDLVIVRTGGLIPVDGLVAEGEALVNQATMTGEPLPVRKTHGGAVFAGTTVDEGQLLIKASKVGGNTRIHSIIQYIKESESSKSGLQGRAERMADAIVPFNFILSGLIFLLTGDPIKAGNVLLVDYSCAIRLSTPLVVLSAMREGNDAGILIKGGRYLEEMSRAETVIFDKTGTLTEARPKVGEVVPFPPFSRREVLRLAACLEEHYPHPVGRAVVNQAKKEGLGHEEEHTSIDYVVAHGISSNWRDHKVLVGSRHFLMDDEKIGLSDEEKSIAQKLTTDGASLLYMAVDGKLAALIVIKDRIRKGVHHTMSALRETGLKNIIMLTGDLESSAAAMSREIGFDTYRSELLPDEKAFFVDNLTKKGGGVIMVGDGLNDSAALSLANVGVALSDGSELAKDVANVQLLNGRLTSLPLARYLSQKTMKRISSNYKIIIGLNSVFLGLGLFGLAGPALTTLLHNATTIAVAWRGTRPMFSKSDQFVMNITGDNEK